MQFVRDDIIKNSLFDFQDVRPEQKPLFSLFLNAGYGIITILRITIRKVEEKNNSRRARNKITIDVSRNKTVHDFRALRTSFQTSATAASFDGPLNQ